MNQALILARRELGAFMRSPLGAAMVAAVLLIDGILFYWQALAEKLLALRPQLPPRLSDALDMSYRSLATADRPFGRTDQPGITCAPRSNR